MNRANANAEKRHDDAPTLLQKKKKKKKKRNLGLLSFGAEVDEELKEATATG